MKKILKLLKILFLIPFIIVTLYLIAIAILYLNNTIVSKKEDPYFFLQPHDPTISFPLKIWQKGEKINEYFWITPKPTRYNMFFQEINDNANSIRLLIKKRDDNIKYSPYSVFYDRLKNKPLAQTNKDETSMILKLYRIGNDNSEILLVDKNITDMSKTFGSCGTDKDGIYYCYHHFMYIPSYKNENNLLHWYYGQYRVELEVIGDWPQLEIDGLEYYIDMYIDYVK